MTTLNNPETTTKAPYMSAQSFVRWLDDMKGAGLAPNDQAAADLLGITRRAVSDMKVRGTDRRTTLACAALLGRIDPSVLL